MRPLTAFTWGYSGWGNAIPELISLFDSTEAARGFSPPLFVDIRARRQVRAKGFSGSPPPFAKQLGARRYRWIADLGNEAILTGEGPMRLIDRTAAWELLGLVLRAAEQERRVVFFCSCASPEGLPTCHRRLVATELRRVARRVGLALKTPEWTQNASKQS